MSAREIQDKVADTVNAKLEKCFAHMGANAFDILNVLIEGVVANVTSSQCCERWFQGPQK